MNNLTIIINNIPNEDWELFWEHAAGSAPKEFNFTLTPTNEINLDYEEISSLVAKSAIELVAGAVTIHAIKIFSDLK